MTQNAPLAVGLDIGTTKIVAVVGRLDEHGKIDVLGIGKSKSLGVQRGVVANITLTIESIQAAVKMAEEASGLKIIEVMVGIAGQHIRSMQHSDYIMRDDAEAIIDVTDLEALKKNVNNLVMMPGEQILHALPQEYRVDGDSNIINPRGMYGSRLEANFHIVVGQIASIKNIARCVEQSELKVGDITLEPLASADSVLGEDEKDAGVVLVDIGVADDAVFENGDIRGTPTNIYQYDTCIFFVFAQHRICRGKRLQGDVSNFKFALLNTSCNVFDGSDLTYHDVEVGL